LAAAPLDESWVKTTCALCPSGCGLDVRVVDGKAVKVEGNPLHPLNQGVCCLKGQASLEVLYSPERLQRPRLQTGQRGGGDWTEISWDEALALVAEQLTALREDSQAHTVAFLHGDTRGQMRALINRFMAAYGSPNTISRHSLDEQATRLAMFLTQGINGLPVYDLNGAGYVMTFGGNMLESSRYVIGYLGSLAFMRRGRPKRGKLVAVHPRLSLTGVKADEWIPIRPGTYGALALGMANVIINSGLHDEKFVRDFTFGFEDFEDDRGRPHTGFKRLVLEQYPLDRVESITGVPAADIPAWPENSLPTGRPWP
jgi:anaerobic selenocysteine-containing dehydrogenase